MTMIIFMTSSAQPFGSHWRGLSLALAELEAPGSIAAGFSSGFRLEDEEEPPGEEEALDSAEHFFWSARASAASP